MTIRVQTLIRITVKRKFAKSRNKAEKGSQGKNVKFDGKLLIAKANFRRFWDSSLVHRNDMSPLPDSSLRPDAGAGNQGGQQVASCLQLPAWRHDYLAARA